MVQKVAQIITTHQNNFLPTITYQVKTTQSGNTDHQYHIDVKLL